jgi:predicted XRE-type DNA-binding protein
LNEDQMPRTGQPFKRSEAVNPTRALAKQIARIIEEDGITQQEAAYRMRDATSQVSLAVCGRVAGFSSERLMRMLAGLGCDIDIVVRRKGTGKVRVVGK